MLKRFSGAFGKFNDEAQLYATLIREGISDEHLAFAVRNLLSPSLVFEYCSEIRDFDVDFKAGDVYDDLEEISELVFKLTYNLFENTYILSIVKEDRPVAELLVGYKDKFNLAIWKRELEYIGHNVSYLFVIAILTINRLINEYTEH